MGHFSGKKFPQFKLWVLFTDGNRFTCYSNRGREKRGTAVEHFKNLVTKKPDWTGRVYRARIYALNPGSKFGRELFFFDGHAWTAYSAEQL